jgi:hypothetical protein
LFLYRGADIHKEMEVNGGSKKILRKMMEIR